MPPRKVRTSATGWCTVRRALARREWAELQKPAKREEHWERRRFKVEQIGRIAARFAWVYRAVEYAVDIGEGGSSAIVEPLGPPPPVEFDWSPAPRET